MSGVKVHRGPADHPSMTHAHWTRLHPGAGRPTRRRAGVTLLALVAGLLVGVAPTPAHAVLAVDEVYPVPAGGAFAVDGHGWGHGRGMSQYGAFGAATLGRTADQITAFYYPGTTWSPTNGNPLLRVRLVADNDNQTEVYPAVGLKVTDMSSGASQVLPTDHGATRWRTDPDSAGLHLQQYYAGVWHPWSLGLTTALVGPVQFSGPALIRLQYPRTDPTDPATAVSREYRGAIRAVQTGPTTAASVDVLPMESYLLGVVPRESSPSWPAEALKAQAVAARSYSEFLRDQVTPTTAPYDICDTTSCQVFGGTAVWSAAGVRTVLEATSTNAAVNATPGIVRTVAGKAIFAEFSSSNGGWSTAGTLPYLIAQRDDWDGVTASSVHTWAATLTAAQLEASFRTVGHLQRLRVTQRDGNGEWGGRVLHVVLEGVDAQGQPTSVATTGDDVHRAHAWPGSADGLRSSWWHIRPTTDAGLVFASRAPSLVQSPGVSTGRLVVQLRNTGSVAWPVADVHLALTSPVGAPDPLVGSSTRPGVFSRDLTTPGASAVQPGDVAEFGFALTGDGVPVGTQSRAYRLRLGAGPLFGPTVSWQVPVAAPVFRAAPAGAVRPADPVAGGVLPDGRTVVVPFDGVTTVLVPASNTGNVAWPAGSGSLVRLGTSPHGSTSASAGADWLLATRPSALSGSSPVAPAAIGTFALPLHGNGRPVGATAEGFVPLWEGRSWMDGALTSLTVVRVDPHHSRVAQVSAPLPATIVLSNAPSGTTTAVVRLRNLGASAWGIGTEGLATAEPSPLATSAWSDGSHPPALAANLSRAGATSVAPGEVGEWRVPLSAFRRAAGSYPLSVRASGPDGPYGPSTTSTVTVTDATFVGQLAGIRATPTIPSGGTERTWIDVKNTGNVAWPVHELVRSATLTVGGSPSYAPGWLGLNRPGVLTSNLYAPAATTVAPGQVARFVIVLAANGRPAGSYSEPCTIVWEGWRFAGLRISLPYRIG